MSHLMWLMGLRSESEVAYAEAYIPKRHGDVLERERG